MEDKNARIAEIESQIKQLQSELAELRKDQSEEQSSKYPNSKLPDVVNEIWDEIERGEWSPGGKYWEKYCGRAR
ncbi:MAG: hypothetical protein IJ575_10670 [Selenomonadaceae bacterium]|nr:hypothetical protein [Selenomonadaceae bacterium]